MAQLVNLDAMISRADFAVDLGGSSPAHENLNTISIRDFTQGALLGPSLRKPDFQRETNHWTPEQVVSLLECFVNGDLIPSVILWQSPTYLFVIDGGHRLSVLRAWIEDDYGDGHHSQKFFGYLISKAQKQAAKATRDLVNQRIGSWKQFEAKINDLPNLPPTDRTKVTTVVSRGLPIQWVKGDADKAEASFFKINTKGTPLDEVEELLLRNRGKSVSIASRAIIRAGQGHKYWSSFASTVASEIESSAQKLHICLFDPEVQKPVKTLDLPLGGPKSVRTALETLIEFNLIATRNQQGDPKKIEYVDEDETGEKTVELLRQGLNLAQRLTGNDDGSLGLHPAVYFYGPTGRHSGPMFMGTVALIARKLVVNDKHFFKRFTSVRERLESLLIEQKDLIATIIQKLSSKVRTATYSTLLEQLIRELESVEGTLSPEQIVKLAGLEGRLILGETTTKSAKFSDDTKSKVFITTALVSALRCSICNGYLNVEKSVSYDHVERKRLGGLGDASNCQLTHPYCNQSIKN